VGTGDVMNVCYDIPFIALSCLWSVYHPGMGRFAIDNVNFDVLIGSIMAGSIFIEQMHADPISFGGPFGWIQFAQAMVVCSFLGLHSLFVIMLYVLSVVFLCCSDIGKELQIGDLLMIFCVNSICAIGCICLEYFVASLYHTLQRQLDENRRLLDSATDGFGAVHCETGLLLSVSPKMAQTLGRSDLLGQHISTFIEARDHVALGQFLGSGALEPTAVLVTCVSKASQFEVRLIPFQTNGSNVGFCVQTIGEVREIASKQGGEEKDVQAMHPFNDIEPTPTIFDDVGVQSDAESRMELDGVGPLRNFLKDDTNLSLSSWTISSGGLTGLRRGCVHTTSIGIQTGRNRRPGCPPAPLEASSLSGHPPAPHVRKSRHRSKGAHLQPHIQEGKPVLTGFSPTPKSTRGNSLSNLVRSFNVGGTGCCAKHIAWGVRHVAVAEELALPCAPISLHSDWQCPQCHSLNEWLGQGDSEDDDEIQEDQICCVCCDVVQPVAADIEADMSSQHPGARDTNSESPG